MKALLILFWFTGPAALAGFSLSSKNLKNGQSLPNKHVFNGFGCTGENISPQLQWSGAPAATKSFALTVYDPDAPTGSGWWHWTAVNIPSTVTEILAGAGNDTKLLPAGTLQGRTDFGKPGFGGACPPVGDKPHRYIFTIHALKVEKLELSEDGSGAMFGYFINANTIAKASFSVKYGRK